MTAVQANALTPLYALPTAVRRRLAGAPTQIDGNTLDPELQLLLRVKALLPDTTKSDAAVARAHLKYLCMLVAGRPVELQRVTELTVRGADGQLGARLYVPRDAGRGLLVFLHGGGGVGGGPATPPPRGPGRGGAAGRWPPMPASGSWRSTTASLPRRRPRPPQRTRSPPSPGPSSMPRTSASIRP